MGNYDIGDLSRLYRSSSQHFNPNSPDEHLELRRCVMDFNLYERSVSSSAWKWAQSGIGR
ncbi:hypothetical protein ACVWXD_002811 [Pseudomonas sp. TE3911]